jgi:putative membrane protein
MVVQFSVSWLRYAPLTSAGLVITAGLVGASSQLLNTLGLWDQVTSLPMLDRSLPWWLLMPLALIVSITLVASLSVVGYLITNYGFILTHRAGSWHLRRGLLTTRETSIDVERLRGISMSTPLALRLVGGRRLSAIVSGLDRRHGSSVLVPPAPQATVTRVAADILGTQAPFNMVLINHGSRARNRQFIQVLDEVLPVAAGLIALSVYLRMPWLLALAGLIPVMGCALAIDRWRSLGHGLVDGWLIFQSGSLYQRQSVLQTDSIISWNFTTSWFQRRAGLTTLQATTAGGRQSYRAPDIKESQAIALTDQAIPGLISQFLC